MADDKSLFSVFKNGIWTENTITVIVLGMCPTLATSNSASGALAMGLAATFVIICSSAMVSMVRNIVPGGVRIAAYVLIMATFVTVADFYLQAFFPEMSKVLGAYVALIVVNCMILARAEIFACKNGIVPSMADALGTGIGFTWVLLVLSFIREFLGSGSIFGFVILSENVFNPWVIMILPPGAFITLGLFIGGINYFTKHRGASR